MPVNASSQPPKLEATLRQGACRVLALDVTAATGLQLHSDYTPCHWKHNQFASDEWLRLAVARGHPWLVPASEQHDVVVLTGHGLSRWCVASTILRERLVKDAGRISESCKLSHGGTHQEPSKRTQSCIGAAAPRASKERLPLCGSKRVETCGAAASAACHKRGRLFRSEKHKRQLWEAMQTAVDRLNTSAPRVVVHANNECPPAWGSALPPKTLVLADRVRRWQDAVVPLAVAALGNAEANLLCRARAEAEHQPDALSAVEGVAPRAVACQHVLEGPFLLARCHGSLPLAAAHLRGVRVLLLGEMQHEPRLQGIGKCAAARVQRVPLASRLGL
jgi:hypothetical protein